MITVIGIFNDMELAGEASSYLLANKFKNEAVDMHTSGPNPADPNRVGDFFSHIFDDEKEAAHYASLGQKGTVVTVHAVSAREAQEAADVLNNYGAIEVKAANVSTENPALQSRIVELYVEESKRLRDR